MTTPIEADVTATLWRSGEGTGWYFLTLPGELSDEIRSQVEHVGFGSVRVTARVGAMAWDTSVFPDARSGCYVLPVKAAVRRSAGLDTGDHVTVRLTVHS